jgi:hypothetical protein
MRSFSEFVAAEAAVMSESLSLHPEVGGLIDAAYAEPTDVSTRLLIACDRMDDAGGSPFCDAVREYVQAPNVEIFRRLYGRHLREFGIDRDDFVPDYRRCCVYWGSPSIPPDAIPVRGRGMKRYWHGCRGGDHRVYLFGAQWTRPGNMYDPARRRRPKVWLVFTPSFVAGTPGDFEVTPLTERDTAAVIASRSCDLLVSRSVFPMWGVGSVEPSTGEKMLALLLSLLPPAEPG